MGEGMGEGRGRTNENDNSAPSSHDIPELNLIPIFSPNP